MPSPTPLSAAGDATDLFTWLLLADDVSTRHMVSPVNQLRQTVIILKILLEGSWSRELAAQPPWRLLLTLPVLMGPAWKYLLRTENSELSCHFQFKISVSARFTITFQTFKTKKAPVHESALYMVDSELNPWHQSQSSAPSTSFDCTYLLCDDVCRCAKAALHALTWDSFSGHLHSEGRCSSSKATGIYDYQFTITNSKGFCTSWIALLTHNP